MSSELDILREGFEPDEPGWAEFAARFLGMEGDCPPLEKIIELAAKREPLAEGSHEATCPRCSSWYNGYLKRETVLLDRLDAPPRPGSLLEALADSFPQPSRPDFDLIMTAKRVRDALDYRIGAEAESLFRLGKLAPADYSRLVEDLGALVKEMQQSSGDVFRDLDIKFHLRIAEAADNSYEDIKKAFAFNYRIAGVVASIEANKEAIVLEHQRIIDALRKRNFDEAQKASSHHLNQVFQRWCPDHDIFVRMNNPKFYASLGPGDAELWSGMVYPLEWVRDWPTLGKAAAAAVGRGAELWYFAFAQSLLTRWRRKGLELNMPDGADLQEKFSAFQGKIAEELEPLAGSPEKARQLARQRVSLLSLDDDSLFSLTRTAQTLGYFMYKDRPDALTQRVALGGNVAWHEIEEISTDNDDMKRHFLITLKEALEKLTLSAEDMREAQLAARALEKLRPRIERERAVAKA